MESKLTIFNGQVVKPKVSLNQKRAGGTSLTWQTF